MIRKTVTVINSSGLHLRPAGILVDLAKKCRSTTTLYKGDKKVNLKSVLSLMAAGVKCKDEIVLECEGETEEADLAALAEAIESGLGET